MNEKLTQFINGKRSPVPGIISRGRSDRIRDFYKRKTRGYVGEKGRSGSGLLVKN